VKPTIYVAILLSGLLAITACVKSKEAPDLASFETEPSLPSGGSDAAMAAAKTY
jgi:hypothetical protein